MGWYRGGTAKLSVKKMSSVYRRSTNLPRQLAMETDGKHIEKDRENPPVNVVIYNDDEFKVEVNDFFFDTLEEALEYYADVYELTLNDWLNLRDWQKIGD